MKKVLVAGATGYLGQHIVKELIKRDYQVRVLIRKESQKQIFNDVNVDDFFVGEVTKPATIQGITDNIDWVFSSIGITRQKDGLTYMDVDFQGNFNLLKEAEKTGVELFTYVSVFGAEKFPKLKIIEAKEKFVSVLSKSPVRNCIIRPTGFFSDMKDFLQMAKNKKVYLFGNGEYKINPISGKDLAVVCVDSMESAKEEVNVGGPDIYTQNQIAQIAFEALNINGKIIHIPLWIRDLTVTVLRTFTSSKFYGPYEFFLTAMTSDAFTDRYGEDSLQEFYKQEAKKIKTNKKG